VLIPVLVALVVVVRVAGSGSSADSGGQDPVAEVSGTTAPARGEDLPLVTVDTAAPTAQADASCPALVQALPSLLVDQDARKVKSVSPYVRAWGNPAVVLVCGVDRPATFVVGTGLIQIDGVQWFVDSTSDPKTVVWTAVDRPVYVQVRVPASLDSASVTEITSHITATLPAQTPTPGS
jgi:hypothetical protein